MSALLENRREQVLNVFAAEGVDELRTRVVWETVFDQHTPMTQRIEGAKLIKLMVEEGSLERGHNVVRITNKSRPIVEHLRLVQ